MTHFQHVARKRKVVLPNKKHMARKQKLPLEPYAHLPFPPSHHGRPPYAPLPLATAQDRLPGSVRSAWVDHRDQSERLRAHSRRMRLSPGLTDVLVPYRTRRMKAHNSLAGWQP